MEEKGQSSRPKRPLPDDDSDPSPPQKRARFPKGKKAKRGNEPSFGGDGDEEDFQQRLNSQLAAKERAKRRNQLREEELLRDQADISSAEVHYEDDANFDEDGIQIEPFNLDQEREEGYFDEDGNFVEFASQHKIKDAWLDNVEVDGRFAEKHREKLTAEEDYQDLSPEDIGKIKRNIANLLQPVETIIQALKRLKGTSSDNRGKMSASVKQMFDQLTEDAMKLMENGEYNVYHEERETFLREAEGYERLACAKNGTLGSADIGNSDAKNREDMFSDGMGHGTHNSLIRDMESGPSEPNASTLQVSSNDVGDKFDMFADDDENGDENLRSDGIAVGSGSTSEPVLQPTSGSLDSNDLGSQDSAEAADGLRSDYVYDPSSGYYYSSSLGYYYDPASGLYCCAASGTWYSFDEQTSTYNEVQNVASGVSIVETLNNYSQWHVCDDYNHGIWQKSSSTPSRMFISAIMLAENFHLFLARDLWFQIRRGDCMLLGPGNCGLLGYESFYGSITSHSPLSPWSALNQ